MKKLQVLQKLFVAFGFVYLTAIGAIAQTTFTYQGKLTDTGNPPTGTYQMEFSLFDAVAGGTRIGEIIPNNSVSVTQGIFTVNLDFGASVFTGEDRFLQIAVRRNAGESFVTLNPRQQITSSPYSIRTLSAAQADLALDSQQLGGIPANEYVTTSSVGNSFIRNSTTQQTADFNVSGNGTLGGTLQANEVRANTGTGFFGLTHTDGTTTLSSYVGGSSSGAAGGWFGTRSNSPLKFFTNNGSATMTLTGGNVGIGTTAPNTRLTLSGGTPWTSAGWTASMNLQNVSALGWEANVSGQRFGIGQTNGGLYFFRTTSVFATTGSPATYDMTITDNGNVGVGTIAPINKLDVFGGVRASFNGSTQMIAETTGGTNSWARLYMRSPNRSWFIGTSRDFNGDQFHLIDETSGQARMTIQPNGGVIAFPLGNITQARDTGGLVKAMIYVNANGTINRCYNGITNSSTGNCGFAAIRISDGYYNVDFGFPVNDRFFSATLSVIVGSTVTVAVSGTNSVDIAVIAGATQEYVSRPFYLLVY